MSRVSQPSPLTGARQHAQALASSGDLGGARAVLEHAVSVGRVNLGEDDPDVLTTARQLAEVDLAAGDPAGARRVLEEAYEAGQWRLGGAHPLMLLISHDLGVVAEELGNRHEARKAFGRVAGPGAEILGPDHWAVARACAYLGVAPPTAQVDSSVPSHPDGPAPSLEPPTALFKVLQQPTYGSTLGPPAEPAEQPTYGGTPAPPTEPAQQAHGTPADVKQQTYGTPAPSAEAGPAAHETTAVVSQNVVGTPTSPPKTGETAAGASQRVYGTPASPTETSQPAVETATGASQRVHGTPASLAEAGQAAHETTADVGQRVVGTPTSPPKTGETSTGASQRVYGTPTAPTETGTSQHVYGTPVDPDTPPHGMTMPSADAGTRNANAAAGQAYYPTPADSGAQAFGRPSAPEQARPQMYGRPSAPDQASPQAYADRSGHGGYEAPSTPYDPLPYQLGPGPSPAYPVQHIVSAPLVADVRHERERSAYTRKAPVLFAAIAAVLAAVIAVVALVVVLAQRGDSGGDSDTPTLGGGPAPGDVQLRDSGSSVRVSWSDPANGTTSFIVSGGHPGEVLKPMGQVSPGQTSFELNGLNPELDYCFAVVAVYSTKDFASSPQACTSRAKGTPRPSTTQ